MKKNKKSNCTLCDIEITLYSSMQKHCKKCAKDVYSIRNMFAQARTSVKQKYPHLRAITNIKIKTRTNERKTD